MKLKSAIAAGRAAVILAFVLTASCTSRPGIASGQGIAARAQDGHFVLELSPGPAYKTTTRWLMFSLPIYPQVACWIETPGGQYIATIFVTQKGAKKTWVSAPQGGRPEALPVWYGLKKDDAAAMDAVSSATQAAATRRESTLDLAPGNYTVKLELNRSYDYNESFTRANAGVAGQPSLIYSCVLAVGGGPSASSFKAVGTGSIDGSDGAIRPGLEGITTALDILSNAAISYLP